MVRSASFRFTVLAAVLIFVAGFVMLAYRCDSLLGGGPAVLSDADRTASSTRIDGMSDAQRTGAVPDRANPPIHPKWSPRVDVTSVTARSSHTEVYRWLQSWNDSVERMKPTGFASIRELGDLIREEGVDPGLSLEIANTVAFVEGPELASVLYRRVIGRAGEELSVGDRTDDETVALLDTVASCRYPLWKVGDWAGILAGCRVEVDHRAIGSYEQFDAALFLAESLMVTGNSAECERVATWLAEHYDAGAYSRLSERERALLVPKRLELDFMRGVALRTSDPEEALPYFESCLSDGDHPYFDRAAVDFLRLRAGLGDGEAELGSHLARIERTAGRSLEGQIREQALRTIHASADE